MSLFFGNEKSLDKKQLFDRWAPSYDWLFPSVFYQAIHQRLLEFIQLGDRAQVLDLGCGTGRLLYRLAEQFPSLQGTGLDLSPEMLGQAQKRHPLPSRLTYVQGDAEQLPFAEAQFDAVFNTLSFLHYRQPEQVFAEVSRVLKPAGCFYLVDLTWQPWSDTQVLLISPGEIRLYSQQAREQLGQQTGLTCQGHYYLLGPVMLTVFTKP
ncbi:class I SAM-dependent methyltransferase [Trichocoleus sp. FACHB-591]|uniref:class I SAM-dependent methyltransferase n=1 Tax=Trichocoleus sp. FACHB-591 TaxID=2692872 RepID=UPI0016889F62|nr:class I SAM-dependent methyltransferase [Trichocoleus sp. FACHB-591]MBD2098523.1 class I SAM-dependent methyltransferase [Trichocoleus sp. FACHB-591]